MKPVEDETTAPIDPWATLLATTTLDTLRPFSLGLAALYGFYSVAHVLFLPRAEAWVMAPLAFGSAVLLGGLHVGLRRGWIKPEAARSAGFGAAMIVMANATVQVAVTGDSFDALNIILFIFGCGCFFLERRAIIGAGSLATALGGAALARSEDAALLTQFAFACGVSLFIAVVFSTIRVNMLRQLAERQELERQHSASIKQSLARERAIINSALDCIVLMDEHGMIVEFNPAAEATFGYRREEAVGRLLSDTIIPPALREAHRRGLENFIATGHGPVLGNRIEIMGMRSDGGEFPVELTVLAIAGATPVMFAGYIRDITERTQARAAIEAARDAALESSQLKSEFLATLSHEIRTPLNAMIGMLDLTLATDLTSQQRDYLRIASTNSEALLHLLNDILDFSKIEASQLELNEVPFDAAGLVESVVHLLAPRAVDSGIEIRCTTEDRIPAQFVGDPNRLRQVLINLVGNAIKFTEKGYVEVALTADVPASDIADDETPRGTLLITVSDTGIGIPPEKLDRIFEKFFQADSVGQRNKGGTGLGLSISRSLVELMGGRVSAASTVGVGSRFTIQLTLPIGDSRPLQEVRAREMFMGRGVLLFGDDTEERRDLATLLTSWGFAMQITDDASEAAGLLATTPRLFDSMIVAGSGVPESVVAVSVENEIPVVCRDPAISDPRIVVAYPATPSRLLFVLSDVMPLSASSSRHADRPTTPHLQGAHILVAEDSPDSRVLAQRILEGAGCRVDTAEDGREAVARIHEAIFDLVIMDLEMPHMDGISATQAIRAFENSQGRERTPIVALTAHALKGTREECLAAGMDDYITKPLQSASNLLTVAARWLAPPSSFLIVDDAPENRLLLERYVAAVPRWTASVADSGAKALEIVSKQVPDVVLLDVEMPGMSGFEVLERLPRDAAGRPAVLMVTGHDDPAIRLQCSEAGSDGFIVKPVRRDVLLRQLARLLAERQQAPRPTNHSDPAASVSTAPTFDNEELVVSASREIADLIPSFLEERRGDVTRLREFADADDLESARKLGHRMKGSGSGYGFHFITRVGAAIETAAKTGDSATLASAIEALDRYLQKVQVS